MRNHRLTLIFAALMIALAMVASGCGGGSSEETPSDGETSGAASSRDAVEQYLRLIEANDPAACELLTDQGQQSVMFGLSCEEGVSTISQNNKAAGINAEMEIASLSSQEETDTEAVWTTHTQTEESGERGYPVSCPGSRRLG